MVYVLQVIMSYMLWYNNWFCTNGREKEKEHYIVVTSISKVEGVLMSYTQAFTEARTCTSYKIMKF